MQTRHDGGDIETQQGQTGNMWKDGHMSHCVWGGVIVYVGVCVYMQGCFCIVVFEGCRYEK